MKGTRIVKMDSATPPDGIARKMVDLLEETGQTYLRLARLWSAHRDVLVSACLQEQDSEATCK